MAADLILGSFDAETWGHVAEICRRHGLALPSVYSGKADEGWFISLLNDASFGFFNAYAAGLEGHYGPDAMEKTAFRNLPWWLESFWLPMDMASPIVDEGVFIGSSIRLLNELAEIRRISKIDIAKIPPHYADMRKDYGNWFGRTADRDDRLSEDDTLRWVWNALHESAQISIKRKVPMMLAP